MNVVFWCLIIAVCSPLIAKHEVKAAVETITTTAPRCLREDAKKCVIISLSQSDPSEDVMLPALSGKSSLQIKRGNLAAFSEKLSNQLGSVEKVQLGPLNLKKIFLKPELLELTAGGNQIDAVEFPAGAHRFKLQVLDLSANRLKDLRGFQVLANLRELRLADNDLESVDLQVFNGMKMLEKLFLDRNQITTVQSTAAFELPVLEYLSLSGNQIEELDVSNWQLDSLTKWDVSANKLVQFVGKLEDRFPSLQAISVSKNEWRCRWLEDMLQRFNESYVMVQDRDEDCQGLSPANICCVPEHTDDPANDERQRELKTLEHSHKDLRATFESQFRTMKVDNEGKLKALESRLKKLEELGKVKKEDAAAADSSSPMKSEFGRIEKAVQDVGMSLKQKQQQWEKQQKDNEAAQRRLGYTILELKRSLERDTKQIAELQKQFETLRDLVRDRLENRDTLMA